MGKKLDYIWTYYKIQICVVVFICIVVGYFGYAKWTQKEIGFQALLFDIHTNYQREQLETEFASFAGIDRSVEEVIVDPSLLLEDAASNYAMASQAKFYSLIGTSDLDVSVMRESNFINYAKADAFLDLSQILTKEELSMFPDLKCSGNGAVIGIYVQNLPKIHSLEGYASENEKAVAGIMYNTTHLERAKKFLFYLLED